MIGQGPTTAPTHGLSVPASPTRAGAQPVRRVISPPEAAEADREMRQILGLDNNNTEVMGEDAGHARVASRRASLQPRSSVTTVASQTSSRAHVLARSDVAAVRRSGGELTAFSDPAVTERARPGNAEKWALHKEFHNRPRVVLDKPPLLLTTSVLDREGWAEPLCGCPHYYFCCCREMHRPPGLAARDAAAPRARAAGTVGVHVGPSAKVRQRQNREAILAMTPETANLDDLLAMGNVENAAHDVRNGRRLRSGQGRVAPGASAANPLQLPEQPVFVDDGAGESSMAHYDDDGAYSAPAGHQGHTSPSRRQPMSRCEYLSRRLFCTRCTIAKSTALLLEEERQRRRYPTRVCCECLFGTEGHYGHSLAVMLVLDILSLGWCPVGCGYMGIGTMAFGWRLRYLVRLRFRIMGQSWRDCVAAACCAVCVTDQVASELTIHGFPEHTTLADVAEIVHMR